MALAGLPGLSDNIYVIVKGPCNVRGSDLSWVFEACNPAGNGNGVSGGGIWNVGTTNVLVSASSSSPPLSWAIKYRGLSIMSAQVPCGVADPYGNADFNLQGNATISPTSGSNANYYISVFNFEGCTNCLENFVIGQKSVVENSIGKAWWSLNGKILFETEIPGFGSAQYIYPKICKDDLVTYGIRYGESGWNVGGTSGTNGVYTPPTDTGIQSNIVWQAGNTNPATEGTARTIAGAIKSQTDMQRDLLTQLLAKSNQFSFNITNINTFTNLNSTNDFVGLSNFLKTTAIATNNIAATGDLIDSTLTNSVLGKIGAAMGGITNKGPGLVAAMTDAVTQPATPVSGSEFAFSIPIGGALNFSVDSSALPGHAFFAVARNVIRLSLWLGVVFLLVNFCSEEVRGVLNQRQLMGNTQSVFGWNANIVIGLAFAVVIAVVLLALGTGITSAVNSVWGSASTYLSALSGIDANYYAMATYVFPLDTAMTCAFTYFSMRYVVLQLVFISGRLVVLALLSG